jgi:phospholipase/carboxylesterase
MSHEKQLIATVEVNHGPTVDCPDASVIWMHGLGADAHDFESIIPMLGLDDDRAIHFIFPNAPKIPVTLNMGMVMRAWYDINAADWMERRDDVKGVQRSAQHITALIENEVSRGVDSRNIVLAGFSQGGAMALYTALRHPEALRGVMVLSGYMICSDTLAAEAAPANESLPILLAHGTRDPMVPLDRAEHMRRALLKAGREPEWHDYPMAHEVCAEECLHIGSWLNEVLAS